MNGELLKAISLRRHRKSSPARESRCHPHTPFQQWPNCFLESRFPTALRLVHERGHGETYLQSSADGTSRSAPGHRSKAEEQVDYALSVRKKREGIRRKTVLGT